MESLSTDILEPVYWNPPWPTLALGVGEIHIWRIPLAPSRAVQIQMQQLLSPAERERANGFRLPRHRDRYELAHGAQRTILAGYLGSAPQEVELAQGPFGKPLLGGRAQGSVEFNLTHSGNYALLAIARGAELGIDLEQIHEVSHAQEIAERYFSPAERAELAATPKTHPTPFLRIWTRKEALAKARGTGLSQGFEALDTVAYLSPGGHPTGGRYHAVTFFPSPDYIATLASSRSIALVRLWDFSR